MPPNFSINLPQVDNTVYLIIVSALWLVLFVMWMCVLIHDIRLHNINETLYKQLLQKQKELEQHQANNQKSLSPVYPPSPSHAETSEGDENSDSSN